MAKQELPELTAEQRKAALEKAAKVRMTVKSVIESIPNVGKLRAAKIMEEIGISTSRRVKGLGPKQIKALKDRFA